MRIIPYILLAYLALGMQVGMARFITWNGAQPNFVLLAVLFIALNAPRDAAMLGCFGLGVIQDLLTQQPPGLHALAYGLIAAMLSNAQSTVYRRHPLTHIVVVILGGLLTTAVIYVQSLIWARWSTDAPGTPAAPAAVPLNLGTMLLAVLYTALLAPFVIGALQAVRRVFAFQPPRRGHRM
jgi:rod shape-determining protein MreD